MLLANFRKKEKEKNLLFQTEVVSFPKCTFPYFTLRGIDFNYVLAKPPDLKSGGFCMNGESLLQTRIIAACVG